MVEGVKTCRVGDFVLTPGDVVTITSDNSRHSFNEFEKFVFEGRVKRGLYRFRSHRRAVMLTPVKVRDWGIEFHFQDEQ